MTGAALQRFNQRLAATTEALFPATVLLESQTGSLPASTGGLKTGSDLYGKGGGFVDEHEIVFLIRKALLSPMPIIGQRLRWSEGGLNFKIKAINPGAATSVTVAFGCEATNETA